jgi:hypothetical protein
MPDELRIAHRERLFCWNTGYRLFISSVSKGEAHDELLFSYGLIVTPAVRYN